jgi:hypothetical protein
MLQILARRAPEREAGTRDELRLLRPYGDTLTSLGRTRDAGVPGAFLTLATNPERVQESKALDDSTDGSVVIDRVKARLTELTTVRDH